MTRAALAKLLILVILAFIICLPEFFTLYRASKVNFLCEPYRPCERGKHVMKGKRTTGDSDIMKKTNCNPSQTEHEKWEQACTQENQSNTMDSDSKRGGKDSEKSWFMCETDTDMAEMHRNLSSPDLKLPFTVSVELRLRDTETLNLTLFGLNNHSFLHLRPSEEEDRKEEGKEKDDEGQRKAFYCCLPALPTSESARQSHCLLWFTNQTVLTATAKDQLPWKLTQKDEWRCVFRVLWLVLLCAVLLTIVTTVIGKVFFCKKPKVHPFGYSYAGQQLKVDGERFTDNPEGKILHFSGNQSWTELSPIQEMGSQDDIETFLEGNVEQCYTANLHHRIHHATSPVTEEQAL